MNWPLNGAETLIAFLGLCGSLLPFWWTRRDARAKDAADKAVKAQEEAMANKDKEIALTQARGDKDIAEWKERYEQERNEHRDDNVRLQDRIDRLEDRLYTREPKP